MIYAIVLVLLAVLALLFLDWSWLKRLKPFRGRGERPAAGGHSISAQAPRELPTLPATRNAKKSHGFDFEMDAAKPAPARPAASDEVERWLGDADIHFRKGEMKAAEDLYLKAAAKDPRCSRAYSRLGVIYLEHGDNWEDAEAAFRQALKTDPENGFILNNLGLVLYHQDRYADAVRHFEQSVRLDELNAARHANLGMAYMAMRQYAKAESSFKKALKLAPGELEYKDLLTESIEKKKAHKSMVRR